MYNQPSFYVHTDFEKALTRCPHGLTKGLTKGLTHYSMVSPFTIFLRGTPRPYIHSIRGVGISAAC